MDKYRLNILNNGLKVLTINDTNLPHCALLLIVRVGGANESSKLAGISHFLEHMPFKATKAHPTSQGLSFVLDNMGAVCNASTGLEVTSYFIKVSNEYLDQGLEMLASMVFDAKLKKKDIETERMVILEEYRKDLDDPYVVMDEVLHQTLFKGHLYANSVIGTLKTIHGITQQDLRHHYDRFYQPNRMGLVAVGKLGSAFDRKVKKLFGRQSRVVNSAIPEFCWKQLSGQVIYKENPHIEQTYVVLAFPCFNMYHQDKYSLDVLKTYLTGGMSSKLFLLLRDVHGLVYSVYSELMLYDRGGVIQIVLTLTSKNLFQSVQLVLETLSELKKKGISEREMKKSKNMLIGHGWMDQEDLLDVADYYGSQIIGDTSRSPILNYKELFKVYKGIRHDELIRVAREVFDFGRLHIVVNGKASKKTISKLKNFIGI